MSANEHRPFEGTTAPLVNASVYGLRAFEWTHGRLEGPMRPYVFNEGINHAECSHTYSFYSAVQREKHKIAGPGCVCGFYAYYNGMNTYHRLGTVEAVVRASGLLTYGSQGFRCEKLQIMGIVDPYMALSMKKTKVRSWFVHHRFKLLVAYFALLAIYLMLSVFTDISLALRSVPWTISMVAWFGWIYGSRVNRKFTNATNKVFMGVPERAEDYPGLLYGQMLDLREAYPNIEYFPSRKEMLKKYPLTKYDELPAPRQKPPKMPYLAPGTPKPVVWYSPGGYISYTQTPAPDPAQAQPEEEENE